MNSHTLLRSIVLSFAASAIPVTVAAQDRGARQLEAPTVEVIGTTPVPGLATPRNQVPSNVQSATAQDVEESQALNLPDFATTNLGSVNMNEVQNNPYQPDVNYRGFQISPLLGTPQGLSVYQDGVRINEPFGDVVNWDLIPQNAISTLNVIPGSNPLFGLNTLGGALSLRTKSGNQFPNTEVEAYAGSFRRRAIEAEHGGAIGPFDYFFAGNWFKEDGWRDFSPSDVKQGFGKVGWENGPTDLDLSFTYANNDLIGNGLLPESFYNMREESIFTRPDNTRNRLQFINLTGSHWLTSSSLISGNVYYRKTRTRTLNGDANEDFEESPNDAACDPADFTDPDDIADCIDSNANGGTNEDTAVNNRTSTDNNGRGVTLQFSAFQGERNQFTVGGGYDHGNYSFSQSSQEGVFDETRGVVSDEDIEIEDSLTGRTRTASLFFTDTFAIIPNKTHLTLSGRYNRTNVETTDQLNPIPPNLDNDFTYNRFNPAVGITHQFAPIATVYGGYGEGNRAPTGIELGCADPNNPCTLPNALAADPFLEQVVARTVEGGVRGQLTQRVGYNLGAFRTRNQDDILFVGTSTSAGFFQNFGDTRRQGLEAGINGSTGRVRWNLNYSFIRATFQSTACLLAENNSSRGTATQCTTSGEDDLILVSEGNTIPGVPKHQLKLALDWSATDQFSIGGSVVAFSDQFVRGNENNQHQAGTFTDAFGEDRTFLGQGETGGYAVVNLHARYRIVAGLEIFARINNLFDKDYFTAGALAENPFTAGFGGGFDTNSDNFLRETFLAPGAPRAGFVGFRYVIDRQAKK